MSTGKSRAVMVLALCAALGAAPSATGHTPGPIARLACEQGAAPGCSEAGNDTLPPNGYGSVQTDVVPTSTRSATEQVEPAPGSNLAAFDAIWATVVQAMPKLAKITSVPLRRLLTCHVFAQTGASLQQSIKESYDRTDSSYDSSYLLGMGACLSLVKSMQDAAAGMPTPHTAEITSTRCDQATLSLPIEVSKAGSKLRLQVNAGPSLVKRSVGLRVTCQRAGAGWRIGMSPPKRTARLGPLVGPHLQIGFANSGNRSATVRTTFSFH